LEQAAARFDQVMLLNHRLIGMGSPKHVFQPEKLKAAFGSHLRLIDANESLMAVTDSCCSDGED
jgi:ABC-type Mn2+/Zn2+ transport system ATPase subunit